MIDQLTKSMFLDQLQTKFQVRMPDRSPVTLQLYEVEEGHSTPTQEQFSLLFRGPKDCHLGQGTFELEHDSMGTFPLFLVPIGPDLEGMCYQAIFSRLKKNSP